MIKSERGEALAISTRLMTQLTTFRVKETGTLGADLRWAMGRYISNFSDLIVDRSLGKALFTCFENAFLAGATITSMDNVRMAMFEEEATFQLGRSIVNGAVMFSFIEQSKIICDMQFRSQSDIDVMIDRMILVIEDIKLTKVDDFMVADYRNLVALSALLIQHLAATRRVLPRIVKYEFPVNYPSLAMANRIYADGRRAEELAAENKTIHPAFMQRKAMALSE